MISYLVGNPGAVPEMPYLALGLSRSQLLEQYVSPFGAWPDRFGGLPIAGRELRRRAAPAELSRSGLTRQGTALELAAVASQRLLGDRSRSTIQLIRTRNRAFDVQLSNRVARTHASVVVPYTTGVRSLHTAVSYTHLTLPTNREV